MYIIAAFILMIMLFVVLPIRIAMWIVTLIRNNKSEETGAEKEISATVSKTETHEKMSSSTVMLLVGTILIVLSGIAFGVASWVNTTPMGRVGIMLAASAVSFLISVIFRNAFKLTGTSIAFFTVGSVFSALTFLTAGIYEMFGSALTIDGELNYLLCAITVIIISVMTMIGHRFYGNKAFAITSITAFYVAIHFIICQLTSDFKEYAVAAMIVHVIITAVIHILKPQKSLALSDIITKVSNVASLLFGSAAICYMISAFMFPDTASISINIIAIAELLFYGIKYNKSIMINAQSILDLLAAVQIFEMIDCEVYTSALLCSFCVIAIYLAHRFIPVIRTRFNEEVTMFASVIASLVPLAFSDFSIIPYGIPAIIVTGIIVTYIFSKDISTQRMAGITFPVVPFAMTTAISQLSKITNGTERYVMTYGMLAIILIIIAAVFRYLPDIAKNFNDKYTRLSDSVLYSSLTVSGIIMLGTGSWHTSLLIFAFAAPVHFLISSKLRNNICTAFSLISLTLIMNSWLRSLELPDTTGRSIVMTLIFIFLIAASKIFFRYGLIEKNETGTRIDTPFIASFIPLILSWTLVRHEGFFFFMNNALLIAALVRRSTGKKKAAVLMSFSSVLFTIAFLIRPFFTTSDDMTNVKINLAIFALLGAAFRYIWRDYPESARKTSQFIWHLTFIGLLIDAFYYQTAGNTIFVLAVIAVIMILSYLGRNKHWFKLSSVSVAAITVYATRDYLMALDWWVYLFVAGLALISVAALNEYYKNKGESLKSKFNKSFAGWSK